MTYALTGGALPDGLTLGAAGALTWTPLRAGTSAFDVRATDALGRASKREFTLTVRTPVAPPPGVVAWYRAEGTADDAIGGHHGTLRNGTGFAVGEVEQGFFFDGLDDFVDAPDAPELRPVSVTVEARIRPGGGSGRRVILAKPLGSGATDSYAVWLDDGVVSATLADGAGRGPVLSAPLVPAPGRWYHVAYTFDDGTRQQALYLDGVDCAGNMQYEMAFDVDGLRFGGAGLRPTRSRCGPP